MPGDQVHLLSLDGGDVRGLSSLMILRQFMATVDPDSPPKPCDYFDLIGGTNTGGIIAVMLGRLQMTVDECITAYTSLLEMVFEKKSHEIKIKGQFGAAKLESAVKQVLRDRGINEDALLKDVDARCKVFVCTTSKHTSDTCCLATYCSSRSDNSDLLDSTTIWQACCATSAATNDRIAIGPFGEEFVDGALSANNPAYVVWNQAQDIWGAKLQHGLRRLVSIGTETDLTAQQFHRDKSTLGDEGRYCRFSFDGPGNEDSVAVMRRCVDSGTGDVVSGAENRDPIQHQHH